LTRSPEPERYRLEFLPEVQDEARSLSESLRRQVAQLVVELHHNPWIGEPMDDRWPENLSGARKLRFDSPSWKGKPRYRIVYRNEPGDGAVSVIVVLAIARRDRMVAYARASARLAHRVARQRGGANPPF
jgi:mRNA-degrading endonuclease RelE of RelBE toxin-antitoxin system